MIPLFGLSIAFAVLLAMHVVRTGQERYWLWIVLAFQPLGGVVYFLAVVLPDMLNGSAETGRRTEAQDTFAEIERRAAKTRAHFRKEARVWRDMVAEALQGA